MTTSTDTTNTLVIKNNMCYYYDYDYAYVTCNIVKQRYDNSGGIRNEVRFRFVCYIYN